MGAARSAAEREAAEESSLFGHPEAAPDTTVAYGPDPDQVVDFYAPRGPGAAPGTPLVVVVHGGAWRAAHDRLHISPFAAFLAGRGFAVASVEYRRGNGGQVAGRWPDTFDDIAAAFDALPELAAEAVPEADPGRTVLTGHSAGGHLALWAAARHVLPAGSPWRLPEAPAVRGVVALAPIADFATSAELNVCGGAFAQLLGEEYEERLAHADPTALLPTGMATTLVQGTVDTEVPPAVAEAYAGAATAAGETPGFTLVDGVGHFPLIDPASAACALVAEEIAQLAW
ncbi:alpha/beta hydrolase [Streptomyces sp. T7(2022)]|uniref:alpha/beta hydrolase n=1 Tax=Streptomyces sp. T7(2022) TaxID=2916034 RepID=UPI001EE4532B|nr:alpha/beta hydrolase [Streptomyces sp. T7(2022)]MCG5119283.1 alpha/beta hydrolase [Streptomyces sp. T7(2022)]